MGSPLRISALTTAGLACPADAAFSPDGSRIVVVGLLVPPAGASACPTQTDDSGAAAALAILDSTTGQLVRLIPLDPLVRGSLRNSGGADHVMYSGLGWSPDGQRVAVVFTRFGDGAIAPENVLDSGLLLLDTAAGTGTILRGDSGFFATASGVSNGFPVWHLGEHAELPVFLPQPGLAYGWSLDGTPYPILPVRGVLDQLPITAGPRYPVGAPDGGPRYTIWQSGLVVGTGSGIGVIDPYQVAFISAFPAWSPDGANVTLMVAGVALRNPSSGGQMGRTTAREGHEADALVPPMPSPAALSQTPPRDAALAAVAQDVGGVGWAVVDWNPSGTLLGSIDCFSAATPRVDLRDTASGQLVGEADLDLGAGDPGCRTGRGPEGSSSYPNLGLSLTWSPSGRILLLCDRAGNALTEYQVRSH